MLHTYCITLVPSTHRDVRSDPFSLYVCEDSVCAWDRCSTSPLLLSFQLRVLISTLMRVCVLWSECMCETKSIAPPLGSTPLILSFLTHTPTFLWKEAACAFTWGHKLYTHRDADMHTTLKTQPFVPLPVLFFAVIMIMYEYKCVFLCLGVSFSVSVSIQSI